MLFIEINAVCFGNDVGYIVYIAVTLQTFKCGRHFTSIPLAVHWKASKYWKRISKLCVIYFSMKSCWTVSWQLALYSIFIRRKCFLKDRILAASFRDEYSSVGFY